jgi:plastocyanin
MRTLPLALIVFLLAAAPAAAATRNVKVGDDFFARSSSPPTVTVSKGTTVKWNWRGRRQHNVVATRRGRKRFQSALKRTGSYSRKINRRGTYRIICSIHQPDMRMKLVVK